MNKQRQAVYGMRRQLLEGLDQKERVMEMTKSVAAGIVIKNCPEDVRPPEWDLSSIPTDMLTQFGTRVDPSTLTGMGAVEIEDELFERAKATYQAKENLVGASLLREAERNIMLHV